MSSLPGYASFVASVLVAAWALTAAAAAHPVGAFEFRDWPGPALKVHFVEPKSATADAPILIVLHGVNRNADTFRDNWIDIAEANGFRVYAPEFDSERFPGAQNYNLGSVGSGGISAFDAIDPLFDAIRKRHHSSVGGYAIFGHSAGAQFVHRFVMFRPEARFTLAIAANAGWYALPNEEWSWPYGMGGDAEGLVNAHAAFQRPLLVMLGEDDKDPNAPYLRQTPEARAQGAHRLERGQNFLQVAIDEARRQNAPLAWRIATVPGVGHENAQMAKAAVDHVTQASQVKAD